MTVAKIAVSLPVDLVEEVRAAVRRGDAPSVSAYVADALREKSGRDPFDVMLEEMLAKTGGPLTDAERRWAARALRGGGRKPAGSRR